MILLLAPAVGLATVKLLHYSVASCMYRLGVYFKKLRKILSELEVFNTVSNGDDDV